MSEPDSLDQSNSLVNPLANPVADRPAQPRTTRVVVTGGSGFLGSFVVEELHRRGYTTVMVPRSRDYDLVDREAVRRLYRQMRPELVIHLAAQVGGIGANQRHPGKFF